ncbi:unnamed protein product [Gemmataceae bacterium]|nr:unnamed protein product [Gemmataceae bacterium]VTU01594.1 unnamed protein product [Gemmataceae bacterium]
MDDQPVATQAPVWPTTIHWSELQEAPANSPIRVEWDFYRREAGRQLAEGHEGRWLLVKGEEIIGIWDSREEAFAAANKRYLMQPRLVKQILTHEPILRGPSRLYLWRS